MRPEDRRRLIAERLSTVGELDHAVVAEEFDVSEMTVRRDFELLERDGLGRRVRGGIATMVSRGYEPPMPLRMAVASEAKVAIGETAAGLVSEGDTVVLDVGTTTLALARALRGRRGLTVVTPSLPIAVELGNEPGIRLIVTGGIVRPGELSLTGGFAEDVLRQLNCDLAFLGVAGVSARVGISDYNPDDVRVKRVILSAARRVVALADSSKLGKVGFSTIAGLDQLDSLVTDAPTTHPELAAIAQAGLAIVQALPAAGAGDRASAEAAQPYGA
ncbi:MAG: transcriptional regulator, DeoR family [Frankiales bacterium]|nr:transcriptional regulator, DeoR family [Frankiales bacterium]